MAQHAETQRLSHTVFRRQQRGYGRNLHLTIFRSCPRTTHDELSCARKPDIVRDKRCQNVTHVFKQLPTGRGRQTGKKAVSATRCFPVTYIAGLTWGASRDFETLGPVRDFSGDFTRRVVPRFVAGDLGEVTQIPIYVYETKKARWG